MGPARTMTAVGWAQVTWRQGWRLCAQAVRVGCIERCCLGAGDGSGICRGRDRA